MPDTLEVVQDEVTQVQTLNANPFDDGSWAESPITQTTAPVNETVAPTVIEPVKEIEQEETFDADEYLKNQTGYDSWETIKNDIQEYQKLKQQPKEDLSFANEESKKFFEYLKDGKEDDLYNFLSEKKKLEKYTSSEINEQNAADIIKLSMQKKFKDLTQDEIEYKFKKEFSLPKEPVKGELEDDEEFEQKHNEWEERYNDKKMEMLIEAKLAKPELEKLKTELILPDLKGKEPKQNEPTPEELVNVQKLRDAYLEKLNSGVKSFNGFEVRYKDEDVEIPVQFIPSEEEKTALKNELETFDVEGFILSRWFDENGQPKVKELMEDVYELKNRERIHQKIANETAAKVRDSYIKKVKNINLNGAGGSQVQTGSPDGKSEMDKLAEFFFTQK